MTEPLLPRGTPIRSGPARSNEDDVRWALDKARRFIFRGGDRSLISGYVDAWLDYARERGWSLSGKTE